MIKGFTQEEFIKRCKKVHGNKYDYSKTIYSGMQNRVNVICPVHGEFFQYALYHSKGGNCPN